MIDYAAEHRLPAIYEADVIVRDGGLMSYGADPQESFDRAAAMVDRILNGASVSDFPVEHAAMGLEIPPTLAALADEVIE